MLFYTVHKQFEVIQLRTIYANYVTDRMPFQYDKSVPYFVRIPSYIIVPILSFSHSLLINKQHVIKVKRRVSLVEQELSIPFGTPEFQVKFFVLLDRSILCVVLSGFQKISYLFVFFFRPFCCLSIRITASDCPMMCCNFSQEVLVCTRRLKTRLAQKSCL